MRILLIPDKFKGSLSAQGVIDALKKGIHGAIPTTEFFSVLASDGGDGFLNSIAANVTCQTIFVDTVDPLGRKITSTYLLNKNDQTAYIELAKASGLELLSSQERNAMITSTYGTGLEIMDAIQKGATKIYVGLGGSATNDGGIGIANALGYDFLDDIGEVLNPIGKNLSSIHSIKKNNQISTANVSVLAVNDVDNPLFGQSGAAYTYGAQKGAELEQINQLDLGLRHLSEIVKDQLKIDCAEHPGSGAAGGAAYGLKAFLGGDYISGIDFILKISKVDEMMKTQNFDYIITGEGKFDEQTLNGKLIKGVTDFGETHGIPVIAVCGKLDLNEESLEKINLQAIVEVRDADKSLEYNMEHAPELVEKTIKAFFSK